MADLGELEVNLFEFQLKSFGFDRLVTLEGTEFAVFGRTETVSEAKLRPTLVRLTVALPKEWIVYDLAADVLRVARDGRTPGPRGTGSALEAAAGTTEFREQGLDWTRASAPDGGYLYVPRELVGPALSEEGIRALCAR